MSRRLPSSKTASRGAPPRRPLWPGLVLGGLALLLTWPRRRQLEPRRPAAATLAPILAEVDPPVTVGPSLPAPVAELLAEDERFLAEQSVEFLSMFWPDGTPILRRFSMGANDAVEAQPWELEAARGGYATHNHPGPESPSRSDVQLALGYGMKEMRVVARFPDGPVVYRLIAPEGGYPPLASLAMPGWSLDEAEVAELLATLRRHGVNPGDLGHGLFLRILAQSKKIQKLAKELGATYVKERL